MPASEQTWRNQKLLHRVFGASGLVLLIATLWMLIADSTREWKGYVQTTRDMDLTRTDWQKQASEAEFQAQKQRLTEALLEAQSQPMPVELVQKFQAEVKSAVEADPDYAPPVGTSRIDAQLEAYNKLAAQAVKPRTEQREKRAQAQQAEKEATAAQLAVQAAQAKFDAAQGDAKQAAQGELEFAKQQAERAVDEKEKLEAQAKEFDAQATIAEHDASDSRATLLTSLRSIITEARFREDLLLSRRKFRSADYDAARARLDLAIRDGLPLERQAEIEAEIEAVKQGAPGDEASQQKSLDNLTLAYQSASAHRLELEKIVKQITEEEDAAQMALEDAAAEARQAEKTKVERRVTWFVGDFPFLGKKWLELPILDAFNSPLKIENLWHEGNTIDYNFQRVRRFDRCTTCHQSIQKSLPGSAVDPAYVAQRTIKMILRTPTLEERAALIGSASPGVSNVYGIRLADEGLVDANDVTIRFVQPADPDAPTTALAAQARLAEDGGRRMTGQQLREAVFEAHEGNEIQEDERPGLMAGDVIVAVEGDAVRSQADVHKYLIDNVKWGEPIEITIKRGVPNPYASHPRLDLFISSVSPHDMAKFACSICHEGQGSATAFKWASHAPNDPAEAKRWALEHGWFDNHHWIFPMFPERFVESACLKCHHDVTELEGRLISADGSDATSRFLEAPAPKLMHGHNLIRKYGCFGCHEVNGHGSERRVGPDMRLEPNVSEVVQQMMADPGFSQLDPQAQQWAEQLKFHPELNAVRLRLLEVVAADKAKAESPDGQPVLSAASHKVGELLKDVESPGTLRKVGPSLRRASHKLTPEFMYDWIRQPSHFRPDTRMPQFFGLWSHLKLAAEEERAEEARLKAEAEAAGQTPEELEKDDSLELSERYEPIELLGIVTYLRERSQSFPYDQPPGGLTERTPEERVANGRRLFENRGCLACHTHKAFPGADKYRKADEIVQGPDLSAVAEKFSPARNRTGPQWLYSWIHNPSRYSPRTLMPNLLLEPYDEPVKDETTGQPAVDAEGKPVVKRIDPIGDLVEFLLAESRGDWEPQYGQSVSFDPRDGLALDEDGRKTLDELVRKNLEDVYFEARSLQILDEGIRQSEAGDIKGAEIELVGESIDEEMKLMYIGRKTITRYGCYGCHDIPGFEDAKPIGTGLADWGRKDPSRLAFEHITHYVEEKHKHDSLHRNGRGGGAHTGGGAHAGSGMTPEAEYAQQAAHDAPHEGALGKLDHEFYEAALHHGNRTGFIWQKLKEPRSYDFRKTQFKKYSERLRMPQFPLTDVEREAVITFVLGLVADPPDPRYIYQPEPRQAAILAGRRVAEKYNCAGCHMFDLERWDLAYEPGRFGEQVEVATFPFMNAHFTSEELAASAQTDRRGLRHASVIGLPTIDDASSLPIVNDFEGDPVSEEDEYDPATVIRLFDLWQPVALDGHPYQVAVLPLKLPADVVRSRTPSDGGLLAKYLVPRVLQQAKVANPNAKGTEMWGWVPPPLVGEGVKVQTDWLHDFLLDPHRIRPEVVLRMPKFNMSSEEASQLVDYFAAKDNATYPYDFSPRRRSDYLAEQQQDYQALLEELSLPESTRFDDARKIVFNKAGCIQCHEVGDYSAGPRGPDLVQVYKRLRGEFVRDWVANPKRILPYTSMPENFKYLPDNQDEAGFIVTKMEADGSTTKFKLVHGTGTQQLDAMVDLLMNFDVDAQQRSPYTALVPKEEPMPAAEAAQPAEATSGSGGSE
jgi:cytochrome c2